MGHFHVDSVQVSPTQSHWARSQEDATLSNIWAGNFWRENKAAPLLYCNHSSSPQPSLLLWLLHGKKERKRSHLHNEHHAETAAGRLSEGSCFLWRHLRTRSYGESRAAEMPSHQCSSSTAVFIFIADMECVSLENRRLIHKQFQSYRQTPPICCLPLSVALPVSEDQVG